MLCASLKFCDVMMTDHLFNIGLGGDQTGHYDLRGEVEGVGALTLTATRGKARARITIIILVLETFCL